MPFIHRCKINIAFWLITGPLVVVFVVMLILAICNPFWFRDTMLLKVQNIIESACNWRNRLLKPMMSKYELFNVIKQTTNYEDTQVKTSP